MDTQNKELTLNDDAKIEIIADVMKGAGNEYIMKKYRLSEKEFFSVTSLIMSELKQKTVSLKYTYALGYFSRCIENRTFSKEIDSYNFSVSQKQTLYKIVRGDFMPTYGAIFLLRRYVSPCKWFFYETEELPKPIEFSSTFEKNFNSYDFESRNELAKNPTVANVFFDVLSSNRKLSAFCRENDVSLTETQNYTSLRRHKNGTKRYTTRPTFFFIMKLKKIVHPDFWFVYPDEVNKEIISQVKSDAMKYVNLYS